MEEPLHENVLVMEEVQDLPLKPTLTPVQWISKDSPSLESMEHTCLEGVFHGDLPPGNAMMGDDKNFIFIDVCHMRSTRTC